MTVRVSVRNRTDFARASAELRGRAALIVEKAARDIEADAKSRARVDTGFMRSAIVAEPVTDLHWTVTGYAAHTIYNEFGTRFMGAQPMFVPALERASPSFVAALRGLA